MLNIDRKPASRHSSAVMFIMIGAERRKELANQRAVKVQKIQGVIPRIASVK